jgi:hypothetical protein
MGFTHLAGDLRHFDAPTIIYPYLLHQNASEAKIERIRRLPENCLKLDI